MATGDKEARGLVVIPPLSGVIFHFELHDWYPIKRWHVEDNRAKLLVCDVTRQCVLIRQLQGKVSTHMTGWNPGPGSAAWQRIEWDRMPAWQVFSSYVTWCKYHRIEVPCDNQS